MIKKKYGQSKDGNINGDFYVFKSSIKFDRIKDTSRYTSDGRRKEFEYETTINFYNTPSEKCIEWISEYFGKIGVSFMYFSLSTDDPHYYYTSEAKI